MKASLKDGIRHYANPLHVYCSLLYVMGKKSALAAARAYERRIFNFFSSSYKR